MNPLEIVSAGPYNSLYLAGFLVALAVALVEGRRRGWPAVPWAALLALTVAGGIMGSKLLMFDLEAPQPGEKTVLGGVAGGMVALLLATRFMRFDRSAPDALVVALPLGFAFGRLGCFLAGCCFGSPTRLPWGVDYAAGSPAFRAQLTSGLLAPDASHSLAVHPTQLYEAGIALAAALFVHSVGARFRSPGSAMIALLILFGTGRFGVEFARGREAPSLLGITSVQWVLLLVLIGLSVMLVWRERRTLGGGAPATGEINRWGIVALGPPLVLLVGYEWLTPLEWITLAALGLVPLLAWWFSAERPLPARAAALALLVPFSVQDSYPYDHFTLGLGGRGGSYTSQRDPNPESCGDTLEDYDHSYRGGGASFGYTRTFSRATRSSVTARMVAGSERITGPTAAENPRTTDVRVAGVGITGDFDRPWVGLRVGALVGSLPRGGENEAYASPILVGRLGRRSGVFGEVGLDDLGPIAFPTVNARAGLGLGVGDRGSAVRVGRWIPADTHHRSFQGGTYFTGTLVTPGGFEIEPFIELGSGTRHAGATLRHRFGPGARQ